MKRTSKFFLLLATLGLLAGCGGKTGPSNGGSSGGGGTPSGDEPYLLNVIYFKNYVSPTRANEIKEGFIQSLGTEVDASRINFFESNDNTVAGIVDQVLFYNEDYPDNQIDAILGLNGISNAGESSQTSFLAKYETDGVNYNYGTSSNVENRKNRKFFWDKEKVNDTYVKGLQNYLTANWLTTEGGDEYPETDELNVAFYSRYVDEDVRTAIQTGFNTYLTTAGKTGKTIHFEEFGTETSSVGDFAGLVKTYNTEHAGHEIDVLLGCRADKDSALANAGYSSSGATDYTYGNAETFRRFWYNTESPNLGLVMDLKAFMDKNYTPQATTVVLSSESATVKVGEFVEVTASLDKANPDAVFTATADKAYATVTVTGNVIKVELSDAAVVGEVVTVTVASEGVASATLLITVAAADAVVVPETYYTVFFYSRYITAERIQELKTGITNALKDSYDHVVFDEHGTYNSSAIAVPAAATHITEYNTAHDNKVDALLGFNGDSDNALSTAGYEAQSAQYYTYGTLDRTRKLWVAKESANPGGDALLQQYLFANYGPTKVTLSSVSEDVKPGESTTVTAALDLSTLEAPVFAAVSNKSYATVTVTENQIAVALSNDAVVGETATITVSSGAYTPATLSVNVVNEVVVEHHLVIAFYSRYVPAANRTAIQEGFEAYLTTNNITPDSIAWESLGTSSTNVGAFADLVTAYNGNSENAHRITVLLGVNGDSNNKLANAGYQKLANNYTYGPSGDNQNNRKIWVPATYDAAVNFEIKALIDYMDASWLYVPAN